MTIDYQKALRNMNETPNFGSILDRQATDIEPPKQLPPGHYVAVIKGQPLVDKSPKKQTEFVRFFFQIISAEDDVDQDALAEAGGFADKLMEGTFYLTEKSAFILQDFLTATLELDPEGTTMRLMLNEAVGKSVILEIGHVASRDGKRFIAEIKGYSKYGE